MTTWNQYLTRPEFAHTNRFLTESEFRKKLIEQGNLEKDMEEALSVDQYDELLAALGGKEGSSATSDQSKCAEIIKDTSALEGNPQTPSTVTLDETVRSVLNTIIEEVTRIRDKHHKKLAAANVDEKKPDNAHATSNSAPAGAKPTTSALPTASGSAVSSSDPDSETRDSGYTYSTSSVSSLGSIFSTRDSQVGKDVQPEGLEGCRRERAKIDIYINSLTINNYGNNTDPAALKEKITAAANAVVKTTLRALKAEKTKDAPEQTPANTPSVPFVPLKPSAPAEPSKFSAADLTPLQPPPPAEVPSELLPILPFVALAPSAPKPKKTPMVVQEIPPYKGSSNPLPAPVSAPTGLRRTALNIRRAEHPPTLPILPPLQDVKRDDSAPLSVNTLFGPQATDALDRDEKGETQFHRDCRKPGTNPKDIDALVELFQVESGKPVDEPNNEGYTPLYYAIRAGNLNLVIHLVTIYNANINIFTTATDPKHEKAIYNALMLAARHDKVDIIMWLCKEGKADPNGRNDFGLTALHFAVNEGNFNAAECLVIGCNANINIVTLEKGQTPEKMARQHLKNKKAAQSEKNQGRQKILYFLRGVALFQTKNPDRPLPPTEKLIDTGRFFEEVQKDSLDEKAIQDLATKTLDINAQDSHGETVLHHAYKKKVSLPTIKALINAGADPSVKNKHDKSVFYYATNSGNIFLDADVRTFFMKLSPAYTPQSGDSALHEAVRCNKTDIFNHFALSDRIIKKTNDKRETALQVAVYCNRTEMLDELLSFRLLANLDKILAQLLYLAAQIGQLRVVKFLVEKYRDKFDIKAGPYLGGETALQIAAACGHIEVVAYLKSAVSDSEEQKLESRQQAPGNVAPRAVAFPPPVPTKPPKPQTITSQPQRSSPS